MKNEMLCQFLDETQNEKQEKKIKKRKCLVKYIHRYI